MTERSVGGPSDYWARWNTSQNKTIEDLIRVKVEGSRNRRAWMNTLDHIRDQPAFDRESGGPV